MAVLTRPVGYVSELGGELGCQVCLDFPALFLFEGVRFQALWDTVPWPRQKCAPFVLGWVTVEGAGALWPPSKCA